MGCPRHNEICFEYSCGGNNNGICNAKKIDSDREMRKRIIDEIFDALRNPLTIDALANKDRIMIDAILKRQYEQFIS